VDLAALPPDVRKASGFPADVLFILRRGSASPGKDPRWAGRKGWAFPHLRRQSRVEP